VKVPDPRIRAAVRRLLSSLPAEPEAAAPTFSVAVDTAVAHRDGYRLQVHSEGLEVIGGSAAGCFYGLQTLAQILQASAGHGGIPCCVIDDEPSFAVRGLLHDVTRGKVPRLETLKLIADRLAALKINQLQLYIEHALAFSFDPEICGPDQGLTPDDVRELGSYCRDRFIDLVPAVATLGHMGRILSLPRYRHLAEIELSTPWEQMTWLQRLRGATLDVLNPQSRALVERIWMDILSAFSAPIVNICGDEPWDLGKGKNSHLSRGAAAEAYVGHLRWTADLCAREGRSCQIWSDVIRNHTELLTRLPRNLAVLNWGYDDRADYDGTSAFTSAGYETHACPGTSGWKRVLNALNLAERNIVTFARAGKEHGASGLVNTDWGDFGHFNQLACSWHGVALGAAMGWNADHPSGRDFDERFARGFLRVPPELISHLRRASTIAESCETWRALVMSSAEVAALKRPAEGALAQAADAAATARSVLDELQPASESLRQDYRELATACRFTELVVDHLRETGGARARQTATVWREQLDTASADHAQCWLARNKPTGLVDITKALDTLK
jgi:hypothetical protein